MRDRSIVLKRIESDRLGPESGGVECFHSQYDQLVSNRMITIGTKKSIAMTYISFV